MTQDPTQVFSKRPPRYEIKLNAVVSFSNGEGAKRVIAQGFNISSYGMAVFMPAHLEVGTNIEIEFTIPDLVEGLRFQAVIRNRREFVYGIALVNSDEHQRRALVKYCTAMSLSAAAL